MERFRRTSMLDRSLCGPSQKKKASISVTAAFFGNASSKRGYICYFGDGLLADSVTVITVCGDPASSIACKTLCSPLKIF